MDLYILHMSGIHGVSKFILVSYSVYKYYKSIKSIIMYCRLSVEQRLAYYKTVLELLKHNDHIKRNPNTGKIDHIYGVCELLFIEHFGYSYMRKLEHYFPEFEAFRPEEYKMFWWAKEDTASRIMAVQSCINLLETK